MKPSLFLLSLSIAPALDAQTLSTLTDVGLFADDGSQRDLKFIPKNTDISAGAMLQAFLGRQAHSYLDVRPSGGGWDIIESADALLFGGAVNPSAGTTASTSAAGLVPGAHAFLLHVPTTPSSRKELRISFNAFWSGADLTIRVDVGNDGSVEWQQGVSERPVEQRFLLTGTQGTDVRVQFDGLAALSTSPYTATTELRIRDVGEPPCSVRAYGIGCGPTVSGSDQVTLGRFHNLSIRAQNGPASSPFAWVLGLKMANRPLPLSVCRLLVEPSIIVPGQTDATGSATLAVTTGPLAGSFFVQAIAVSSALTLVSSDGLWFDCR